MKTLNMKTMKRYKFLTILAFFAFLFTSCEKYLEEMPQNKLMPTTITDYEQLLNRAYITKQILPFLDAMSDDVALIASDHGHPSRDKGDEYVSAYMWDETHESSMLAGDMAFSAFYESILYTNLVVNEIENAVGDELNESNNQKKRLHVKGEALALRAYSYFYLVNLYGEHFDPATAAEAMGVPINLSAMAEDIEYTRASVKDVYDLILSDLEEGVRLMEENPLDKRSKFRFGALSAKAFLSRVYLFTHRWQDAYDAAVAVIEQNPVIFNLHEAGTRLNWDNNNSSGWSASSSMWGTDYLHKDNSNVLFVNGLNENYPIFSYYASHTTFSVNRDFAGLFEEGDVRRFYFMKMATSFTVLGNKSKLTYAKNRYKDYMSVYNTQVSSGYSRVIRTEEMYLNAAEALARLGRLDESVGLLNALRVQKFRQGEYQELSAAGFDGSSLLEFTLLERRKELCFEGHRWFDLKRTERPAMTRVGYEERVALLEKDDNKYVLQIPARELSVNPGIGPAPR